MRSAIFKTTILFVLLVLPMVATAQNIRVPDEFGLPGTVDADIKGTITFIIKDLLLPIAGVIAILFIIVGGFQYMLAGANEDLAKRGKNTLVNAIIGLIIIILSYVIITVITNTLLKIP
jgi:uncharacterized membrane protein